MIQTTLPDRTVLTEQVLSHAVFTATVNAPIEKIDIFGWLSTLPDPEHQHQHHVYETAERDHCHLVSISDVLTPAGWTTCQVVWCLQAERIDEKTSKYTNTETSHPTVEFMEFVARNGQSFAEAAAGRQAASRDHGSRETPLYAAAISRHANAEK